jgi:copper(I)-binding protein
VMFMGITRPLKEGDVFPLTLTMESGYDVTVDVHVGALTGEAKPMQTMPDMTKKPSN